MRRALQSLYLAWKNLRRFRALSPDARAIVFYAEDAASWVHFEPILCELTGSLGRNVCYLSSCPTDPILENDPKGIRAFYIGDGMMRTHLFLTLKSCVMVMTMPDLNTFHIKRSMAYPVHYAYVFHSMVSTHMIYRPGAFDHFDTLLCVGPHHVQEVRATEAAYGLKPKHLVEHGYGRLDSILQERARDPSLRTPALGGKKRVLVAPSWGPHGLMETKGEALVQVLLQAGFHVTVRPHPMTARKCPQLIPSLRRRFGRNPDFTLQADVGSSEALHRCDVMISDWSGVALEYAFGLESPVVFVDVPRKVNNPKYDRIPYEPLEAGIRTELGVVVPPDHLDHIPAEIEKVCADAQAFSKRIREARSRTVFNVGCSGAIGAACLARLADEQRVCSAQPTVAGVQEAATP